MQKLPKTETARLRNKHIGKSCQIFFPENPLKITRAAGQYMYDENGVQFLDCINNVCHVGHCHPDVVKAASEQMSTINTNSRFLHDNLVLLAQKLTATLPDPISVVYLCNSGSEATDLALQLARCHTKAKVVLTLDRAYHGHVSSAMSVSPYKYTDKNVFTQLYPDTKVVPCPDSYRGKYMQQDEHIYIDEVNLIIEECKKRGQSIAAFIAESMQSCGGQIMYPENYLKRVYELVRQAGGVCIADEVQVGFGRMGSCFWAFQTQGVVPDIVTIGKPMGNGHPVSAVITTPEIAESHAQRGIQYFNTFGGNPVSCAVALAVLDVIDRENLMENALKVGTYLKERFTRFMDDIRIVGDIRGQGMFLGIDLVKDRNTREPATDEAEFVVSRMRHDHILISRDGPHSNVIKFKPPLCFSMENAEYLADKLHDVLGEAESMMHSHALGKTESPDHITDARLKSPLSTMVKSRLKALKDASYMNGTVDDSPDEQCSKKVRMS